MNKLIYYTAIFVITIIAILIIASMKIGFDYAIIIAVFGFFILVAIKNS